MLTDPTKTNWQIADAFGVHVVQVLKWRRDLDEHVYNFLTKEDSRVSNKSAIILPFKAA